MKLNFICFAMAIAEQTTTWETTTTEFTTQFDDWCGRHHDTLESFTRQVSILKETLLCQGKLAARRDCPTTNDSLNTSSYP